MQKKIPWHEDDSFWETWGPYMFDARRIEKSKEDVDGIVSLLHITPGDHILDLGCGIGRISLELARRGFEVTGVDRTRSYLDQARKQAGEESLEVELIQDDMRHFSRPDSFDSVISWLTSFSYFEDAEDDRQVVINVYNSLKPGGTFIIDTHGKETLAAIFKERDWSEEDGVIRIYERKVFENWSWMWNRWILLKGNQRIESEISHRLYAAAELQALLTSCGFTLVDIYGNIDGSPYDHRARRLIAVGHK